jgi:predicted TIM-barrel fold metal-dependent hydrolase
VTATTLSKLRIFDADNHFYETRDAFTRYIDPEYRDRTVRPAVGPDGVERIMVDDKHFTYHPVHWELVPPPGDLRDVMQRVSKGEVEQFYDERAMVQIRPEFYNREARLAVMDQQGIEGAMIFGTTQPCVEAFMDGDPGLVYGSIRAYNRWLAEEWGFAYQNRIFGGAMMSLIDLDRAVAELEWLIAQGVRVVYLRPGPQGRRSPADPYFDPFWARIQEAGVVVGFHSSESSYNEYFSVYWGEDPHPSSHTQSAFQWVNFFGDRPIMDTLSALVLHNLFGRFPDIKVATIENGSLWVTYLLKAMDKMKGMGRGGPWLGGKVKGRPSDIFKEHVYVSPFHEEDINALVNTIGAERVLFGSDFPHAEGLGQPADYAHALDQLSEAQQHIIMGDNLRTLLRVP